MQFSADLGLIFTIYTYTALYMVIFTKIKVRNNSESEKLDYWNNFHNPKDGARSSHLCRIKTKNYLDMGLCTFG